MLTVDYLNLALEYLVALEGEQTFLAGFGRLGVVRLALDRCILRAVLVQLVVTFFARSLDVLKSLLFLARCEVGLLFVVEDGVYCFLRLFVGTTVPW